MARVSRWGADRFSSYLLRGALEVIEESPEEYVECNVYEDSCGEGLHRQHCNSTVSQEMPSSHTDKGNEDGGAKTQQGRRRPLVSRDSMAVIPRDTSLTR